MKRKTLLGNFISRLTKTDEPDPVERICMDAQQSFYEKEYERLHTYRIPRPLIEENGICRCPRCQKVLISKEVFEKKGMSADYCIKCGQRIFVRRISEAAARYLKEKA